MCSMVSFKKKITPSLVRILGQSNHVIMTFSYYIQEYGHDLDIINFNWLGLIHFVNIWWPQ